MKKPIIPIFFATDERYAPMLSVTIRSLAAHASPACDYRLYVLVDALSEDCRARLRRSVEDAQNVSLDFVCVREKLDRVGHLFHLRDYYSQATYFRFFIPALFPEYRKGIYLDCDIVLRSDVARLYRVPLGTNLVAACPDEVMTRYGVFGEYAEEVLNIPRGEYFNAGVLVMNLDAWRRARVEEKFVALLGERVFRVTQDQDYLNVLSRGRVRLLPLTWNKTSFPGDDVTKASLVHFKLHYKPWRRDGVPGAEDFWQYAAKTPFSVDLTAARRAVTPAERARDEEAFARLTSLARAEITDARDARSACPTLPAGLPAEA